MAVMRELAENGAVPTLRLGQHRVQQLLWVIASCSVRRPVYRAMEGMVQVNSCSHNKSGSPTHAV